jgi:uncharacterized membrane protein YjfL (UPF0719 family)
MRGLKGKLGGFYSMFVNKPCTTVGIIVIIGIGIIMASSINFKPSANPYFYWPSIHITIFIIASAGFLLSMMNCDARRKELDLI